MRFLRLRSSAPLTYSSPVPLPDEFPCSLTSVTLAMDAVSLVEGPVSTMTESLPTSYRQDAASSTTARLRLWNLDTSRSSSGVWSTWSIGKCVWPRCRRTVKVEPLPTSLSTAESIG